jgi:hypothetical protein
MSEAELDSDISPQNDEERHHSDLVQITINNNPVEIHRGEHTVAELKSLGSIPAAYVLIQVIDGTFHQLPDNGHVVIKGGEVFLGQPRTGQSS